MTDARPTVLVADDHAENRRLFALYLGKVYDVVEASSGTEVLEIFAGRPADAPIAAALLDINYQGGPSGFDVLVALRADARWAGLPTVALTAHASPEDRVQCLAAGFDAYLSKPVFRAPMLETVAALLARVPA